MQGRDLFVRSVQLPDFLLTHAEYNNIQVPQIKNFKVATEKTTRSAQRKVGDFF